MSITQDETENSGVETSIDYIGTLDIRMDLSIQMMQKFTILVPIDDTAESKLKQWQNYYKQLVVFKKNGQYEDAYKLEIPEEE